MNASITVLIATYNRESVLQKTLENFKCLDSSELELNIVIVDNNSTDKTADLIREYQSALPLTYLFQPIPGKNNSLNLALDKIALGEIVLFTDDDVKPSSKWLLSIAKASKKHPNIAVFGGPVHMIWPQNAPTWAKAVEDNVYPQQNLGNQEKEYPKHLTPIGPNFWVRRDVFTKHKFRYDTSLGPIPNIKKRKMGSETSFLLSLKKAGFTILYVPEQSVGHYVTSEQITHAYIINRAKTHGRFLAHIGKPFDKPELYKKFPLIWKFNRTALCVKEFMGLLGTYFCFDEIERTKKQIHSSRWRTYHQTLLAEHEVIWEKQSLLS